MNAEPGRPSIRERFREQVRDDVKAVALEQLAKGGARSISLNAIAKELGVSGPALYRYYANRDELLSSLVIDAYGDLRAALAAESSAHGQALERRIRALAHAYRAWANEQPNRYELLFKPPLPDYDAHSTPIAEAGRTVMSVVLGAITDRPGADQPDSDEVLQARSASTPEYMLALRVWSRLHGFVSLELGGAYDAMQLDVEAFFDSELAALAAGPENG